MSCLRPVLLVMGDDRALDGISPRPVLLSSNEVREWGERNKVTTTDHNTEATTDATDATDAMATDYARSRCGWRVGGLSRGLGGAMGHSCVKNTCFATNRLFAQDMPMSPDARFTCFAGLNAAKPIQPGGGRVPLRHQLSVTFPSPFFHSKRLSPSGGEKHHL
jgi:hypothetical protein